ncbi:MAG: cysteine peptidase family C39 domain-containing protein [Phocaeicola vulgatus]
MCFTTHDASDCGVACLLSIIRYYMVAAQHCNIWRELSGTTKQGTTLLGLYQAAGQVGFDAKGCETDILSLKRTWKSCNPSSCTRWKI